MPNTVFVGDIHGCIGPLKKLLTKVLLQVSDVNWIFLGDYIDRGPDSKGVIDTLINFSKDHHCQFLMGNHEDMMLKYLAEDPLGEAWMNNGGRACLESYGIKVTTNYENRPKLISELNLSGHMDFFNSLKLWLEGDDYIAVHAGLDPDDARNRDPDTILWIRNRFIESDFDFGKKVIFGHTPRREGPVVMSNKIGIDTGCAAGGELTALVWPEQTIIQVENH